MLTPTIKEAVRDAHQPRMAYYHKTIGNIVVASQRPDGKSKWAKWVKEGYLDHFAVVWVYRLLEKGHRQWLAISLDTGRGQGRVVELHNWEGQAELKKIEEQTAQAIAAREQSNKEMEDYYKDPQTWDNLEEPGWPQEYC